MDEIIEVKNLINRDMAIALVTDGLGSQQSVRAYARAMNGLLEYLEMHQAPFNKATVNRYRTAMMDGGIGTSSINQRLSAIRKLALELSSNKGIDYQIAMGIMDIKNVKAQGKRLGNWLKKVQVKELLALPSDDLQGLRDSAVLSLLVSTGLRRTECASLTVNHLQMRSDRPVIVDVLGKGNKFRSIPAIKWAFDAVHLWTDAADITSGPLIRGIYKGGKRIRPTGITAQGIRDIVVKYSDRMPGIDFAPHDLRRTFAQLAYQGGSDIRQLQLSLGHASIKTTEIYLGIEQSLVDAPADFIDVHDEDGDGE